MKKSIRKPIRDKDTTIRINKNNKKENNIIYLKQRYSHHYKKGNWQRANEYNIYLLENYHQQVQKTFCHYGGNC